MKTISLTTSILLGAFVISFHVAFANLEINEIMYDLKTGTDTGREWVEIYNSGSEAVDLSDYRFSEGNTDHKLTLKEGDKNIASLGYALIVSDPVKFKQNYPSFVGTMFDSSFSLNNSGESISLKDSKLEIVATHTYTNLLAGAGDGYTLGKVAGVWGATVPTPGLANRSYAPTPTPKTTPKPSAAPVASPSPTSTLVQKAQAKTEVAPVSTPVAESNSEAKKPYTFISILVVLLGGAGAIAYRLMQKKTPAKPGEDFEIESE